MYPFMSLFNIKIPLYGIMALLGSISFIIYFVFNNKHTSKQVLFGCLFSILIGSFLGAHLLYGIVSLKYFHFGVINSIFDLIKNIYSLFGGWVFYGGLIGGIIGIIIYTKLFKLNTLDYLNICAPSVCIFHFFGRIGCFLTGCCYGVESHWGFTFHKSLIPHANDVNRFPIQLIESFYCLLLFLLLNYIFKKTKFKNNTGYLYLVLYSFGRFIFEFFRGDEYRGFLWLFSTSQWISIILLIVGFCGIIKARRRA